MGASFQIDQIDQIDADLLAISQSMIYESRVLLASLRDDQSTNALLRNSRAVIDKSRRLLAALEPAASSRRNVPAHEAIAIATVPPVEQRAGVVRANVDRNPPMLSVHVFRKESCFGWTVYSPNNDLLGRGSAQTEHKARIDALRAGMTYIDRSKGRSASSDTSLH